MCNRWLTEKMPNFLDNSSHFVLFVLVEIEDVAEFLTFGRNNFERWLLDNFSHFVLFVLVEIEDVAEFLTYRRKIVERWLLDNFSRFVLFALVEIKDAVEFLTDRRNIVERRPWQFQPFCSIPDCLKRWRRCGILDLQTKYCRAFLIITTILFH